MSFEQGNLFNEINIFPAIFKLNVNSTFVCKTAKIAIISEVLFTFVPSARHLFEIIFPLVSFRIIYLKIYAGVLKLRENKYSWSISFAHKQKIVYISRTNVFPLTSSYLHKTLINITLACHHQWSSKKWFHKYYLTARNIGKSMEKNIWWKDLENLNRRKGHIQLRDRL